jgi:anion-transporting  ArsA/GET3 family ATPase
MRTIIYSGKGGVGKTSVAVAAMIDAYINEFLLFNYQSKRESL